LTGFDALLGWSFHDFEFDALGRLELKFVDFVSLNAQPENRRASIVVERPTQFSFRNFATINGKRPSLRAVHLVDARGYFDGTIDLDAGQISIERAKTIRLEPAHLGREAT
jgi:hypothetical protein